jgi:hypothetical protein
MFLTYRYDLNGWAGEYPDTAALRALFLDNEFGNRVLHHIPVWKTDVQKIAAEMETLLGISTRRKEIESCWK